MKIEYLAFLCCSEFQSDFSLEGEVEKGQKIRKGSLQCTSCQATYSKNKISSPDSLLTVPMLIPLGIYGTLLRNRS